MAPSLVLPDSLKKCLGEALSDIATSLATEPESQRDDGVGLASGLAGRALFFHHLGLATGAGKNHDLAVRYVVKCAEALASIPLSQSLYSGLSGIAWLIAHVQRDRSYRLDYDLSDVDALLLEVLSGDLKRPPHFDLVDGLVGLGVYFLERLPAASAVDGLHRVTAQLAARAERHSGGVAWRTPPEVLSAAAQTGFPRGQYDLGLAHGSPGVIAFLSLACSCGAAEGATMDLLRDGVSWLFSCRLPTAPELSFPFWCSPEDASLPSPARTAWCYGDPGVAYALLLAAKILSDQPLDTTANKMAAAALRRPMRSTGVVDASLCHGSAGLAHLSHVLWLQTRDAVYAAATARWLAAITRHRKPGRGVAGFQHYVPGNGPLTGWKPTTGFLTGAAGVGLALTFALHPIDRSWDRLLLMS